MRQRGHRQREAAMLRSIRFKQPFRMFKQGELIQFQTDQPNLLVGDQGTGKTTLIEILGDPMRFREEVEIDSDPIDVLSFSAEFDNARQIDRDTATGRLEELETRGEIAMRHYESLIDEAGVLWLLDEPETGLSIRSCYRLRELILTAIVKRCQVVAAVNSPILIKGVSQVFNLDNHRWVDSNTFIDSHAPKSSLMSSSRIPRPSTTYARKHPS